MRCFQVFIVALFMLNLACNLAEPKKPTYFTGQIEYTYSYESDVLNIDSLSALKPSKSIFRFDLHNYQSQFFGQDTITYYYLEKINRALSKTNNKLDSVCQDYGVETDSLRSLRVYDGTQTILGYTTQIIEFQGKYFWNRYEVSKKHKISPATYSRHESYNWSVYGSQTEGGLILRSTHDFGRYSMIGQVCSIKVGKGLFHALDIPEGQVYQLYHKTTHIFQSYIVEMFVENARHSTTMTALFASILTNYFQNIYTSFYSTIGINRTL